MSIWYLEDALKASNCSQSLQGPCNAVHMRYRPVPKENGHWHAVGRMLFSVRHKEIMKAEKVSGSPLLKKERGGGEGKEQYE